MDYVYCPHCGKWKTVKAFYSSTETASGIEHFACKECLIDMCTDKDKDGNRIDNKQKTINTFRRLDWVFIDSDYESQINTLAEGVGEKIVPRQHNNILLWLNRYHNIKINIGAIQN